MLVNAVELAAAAPAALFLKLEKAEKPGHANGLQLPLAQL